MDEPDEDKNYNNSPITQSPKKYAKPTRDVQEDIDPVFEEPTDASDIWNDRHKIQQRVEVLEEILQTSDESDKGWIQELITGWIGRIKSFPLFEEPTAKSLIWNNQSSITARTIALTSLADESTAEDKKWLHSLIDGWQRRLKELLLKQVEIQKQRDVLEKKNIEEKKKKEQEYDELVEAFRQDVLREEKEKQVESTKTQKERTNQGTEVEKIRNSPIALTSRRDIFSGSILKHSKKSPNKSPGKKNTENRSCTPQKHTNNSKIHVPTPIESVEMMQR